MHSFLETIAKDNDFQLAAGLFRRTSAVASLPD